MKNRSRGISQSPNKEVNTCEASRSSSLKFCHALQILASLDCVDAEKLIGHLFVIFLLGLAIEDARNISKGSLLFSKYAFAQVIEG